MASAANALGFGDRGLIARLQHPQRMHDHILGNADGTGQRHQLGDVQSLPLHVDLRHRVRIETDGDLVGLRALRWQQALRQRVSRNDGWPASAHGRLRRAVAAALRKLRFLADAGLGEASRLRWQSRRHRCDQVPRTVVDRRVMAVSPLSEGKIVRTRCLQWLDSAIVVHNAVYYTITDCVGGTETLVRGWIEIWRILHDPISLLRFRA